MFLHIKEVKYLKDYELEIVFSDKRRGVADLAETLTGPVFEPLKNKGLFSKAAVDPELETVVWPNGADLAPEYLYFLAFRNDGSLREMFEKWGYLKTEALWS
jgi:hypothetical protein